MHQCCCRIFPSRIFHSGMASSIAGKDHKKGVYRIQTINANIFPKIITGLKPAGVHAAASRRKKAHPISEFVKNTRLDTRHGFTRHPIVVIEFPDFGIAALDKNQIGIKTCPLGQIVSITQRIFPGMAAFNRC